MTYRTASSRGREGFEGCADTAQAASEGLLAAVRLELEERTP
ncbi:hypothetical protein ACFWV1_00820 [Streptomyces sp. NPDC058700]